MRNVYFSAGGLTGELNVDLDIWFCVKGIDVGSKVNRLDVLI